MLLGGAGNGILVGMVNAKQRLLLLAAGVAALVALLVLGAYIGYRFARPPVLSQVSPAADTTDAPDDEVSDDTDSEPTTLTVLIAGADGALADTIMLYVAPLDGSDAAVVSIPRDLWFEGNKINALLPAYGVEYWSREIGRLLDLSIDHHVIIQMDAFVDAVDALGGVEVKLEEEFEDPDIWTGNESFGLFLQEGVNELSGGEALAFARSRQFTSDFDRAERQQLVLDGIRERFDRLSVGDAAALADLLRRLREYLHTDIGFTEMIEYYRRFGRGRSLRRLVLSTDNVLYHTYSKKLPEELQHGRHTLPAREEPSLRPLELSRHHPRGSDGEDWIDLHAVAELYERRHRPPLFPDWAEQDEQDRRELIDGIDSMAAFRRQLYSQEVANLLLLEQRGEYVLRPLGERWNLLQAFVHAFLAGYGPGEAEATFEGLEKTYTLEAD